MNTTIIKHIFAALLGAVCGGASILAVTLPDGPLQHEAANVAAVCEASGLHTSAPSLSATPTPNPGPVPPGTPSPVPPPAGGLEGLTVPRRLGSSPAAR